MKNNKYRNSPLSKTDKTTATHPNQDDLFSGETLKNTYSYGPIDAYETDEDPYMPVCVYGLPAA